MTKKNRTFLLTVIPLLLLFFIAWQITSRYELTYRANWGFSLPITSLCREIYAADSGASFHGDGIRCHVYSYKYEDDLKLLFTWAADRTTDAGIPCATTASLWLDALDVPTAFRPDADACTFWYNSQPDGSELIVLMNPEENRLYILERFL
ncbi:MAG: hypothetical protein IJA85_03720 [Clostridia bacterium]|nr:hypothetical protein [Clostridia bacterium]